MRVGDHPGKVPGQAHTLGSDRWRPTRSPIQCSHAQARLSLCCLVGPSRRCRVEGQYAGAAQFVKVIVDLSGVLPRQAGGDGK